MRVEYRFPVVDMHRDLCGRICDLKERHIAVATQRYGAWLVYLNRNRAGIWYRNHRIIKRARGKDDKAWINEGDSGHGISTAYLPETKRTVPF